MTEENKDFVAYVHPSISLKEPYIPDAVIDHPELFERDVNDKEMDVVVDNANETQEPTIPVMIPAEKVGTVLDDAARVKNLFGIRDMMQTVKAARNEALAPRNILGADKDDISDKLEKAIKDIDVDYIINATEDEINKLYTTDEGEIEIDIEFDEPAELLNFKREFLKYMKESSLALIEIDSSMERLNAELLASTEEFNKISAEFGTYDIYIQKKLDEMLTTAEGDELIRLQAVKNSYEEALSLNFIHSHYSQFSPLNTIRDLKSPSASQKIYDKYKRKITAVGIKTDLTDFIDIERFLPEKYQGYSNVFLFSIMKIIAYNKEPLSRNTDAVFLSQLAVNLRNLMNDKFIDAETKETFIGSIAKVLDLFIE